MKFSDYKYERLNIDEIKKKLEVATSNVKNAKSANDAIKEVLNVNEIKKDTDTMASLCYVRYTINVFDEFYEAEQEFIDETSPVVEEYFNNFNKALVASPFINELENRFGKKFFEEIRLDLKTFSPDIIPLLQEENKLSSAYSKLIASAKINFDGKELNIRQVSAYFNKKDRGIRREAEEAIGSFLEENEDKFDDIYDKLVKVRCEMARILGFDSYVELGYARLGRMDYDSKMVKGYRDEIYSSLVPLVSKMYEAQRVRLGLDTLMSYDLAYEFASGNPTPQGETKELVEKANKMYHEMSKETGEFFDFMVERELMDLESKKGKDSGGYCTYFPNYDSPFIFSNFNGTSDDIDVLTHEAGHAFQAYCSKDVELLENMSPTLEACEIHSMSMEFFAWPWMNLFFPGQVEKRLYSHLSGTITFLPYGALVDHFQHEIYLNPLLSKDERKALWRKLEKKYCPWKVYGNKEYDKGTRWFLQGHIFESPFYYIDYTLAQVCAQQFFIKNLENHEKAWQDYYALCKAGGSDTFLNLLKVANLKNPFEKGTIEFVTEKLNKYLETIDKEKLK